MNIIFALGIILHKALTFKKDKVYPVYNSTIHTLPNFIIKYLTFVFSLRLLINLLKLI